MPYKKLANGKQNEPLVRDKNKLYKEEHVISLTHIDFIGDEIYTVVMKTPKGRFLFFIVWKPYYNDYNDASGHRKTSPPLRHGDGESKATNKITLCDRELTVPPKKANLKVLHAVRLQLAGFPEITTLWRGRTDW